MIKSKNTLIDDVNDKLKIAKSKGTSEKELIELLNSEHQKIRYAVVSNENFSLDSQIALAIDNNTSIKILEALSKSSYELVRNHVTANKNCPLETIEILFSQKDALMGIASNIFTPVTILEQLLDYDQGAYKEFLASNKSTPVYILEQLSIYFDDDVRMNIARNPFTPIDSLIVLAKDECTEVKCALLYNDTFRDKHIEDLLVSLDEETNIDIAKDTLTPKRVLKFLSNSKSNNVKYELVYNTSFTEMLTKDFVLNLDEETKVKVAKNLLTDDQLLNMLVNDNSFDVKCAIVFNENTSDELIKVLADNKDVKIRCIIAENKKTSEDILEDLINDENPSVSEAAKLTLDSLSQDELLKEENIDEELMHL